MKIYYIGDRILNVTTGGEKYMKEVLNYLDGFTSLIYLEPNIDNLSKNNIKYNLKFKSIFTAFKSNLWAIMQLLKFKGDEIIITNSYFRHWFFLFNPIARYIKRCKVVSFVNAIYYYSRESKLLNRIDKVLMLFFLSSTSLIVANSKSTREELIKLGINGHKIKVIYPRLDLPNESLNKIHNYSKNKFDVIFVGYCDPVKEIEVLVKAIGLCKDFPIFLHIIGDDQIHIEYVSKIKYLIRQHDIEKKVDFYGRLEKKALFQMFEIADILVSPGRGEGYGRVLVEAMCFGLPVIGTNGGASKELIENGVNGFLFEPGNPEDLKDKIITLFQSEEMRIAMGVEAKKMCALANFSNNIGEQFYHILQYEGLIPLEEKNNA